MTRVANFSTSRILEFIRTHKTESRKAQATLLNAEGLTTISGKPWTNFTVSDFIKRKTGARSKLRKSIHTKRYVKTATDSTQDYAAPTWPTEGAATPPTEINLTESLIKCILSSTYKAETKVALIEEAVRY